MRRPEHLEYYRAFYKEDYESPCAAAKEDAQRWINEELGKDAIVVTEYRPPNGRSRKQRIVWLAFDGKNIYQVVVHCLTLVAEVLVRKKTPTQKALKTLATTAKVAGVIDNYPLLQKVLQEGSE